jgi:hypothetical protein
MVYSLARSVPKARLWQCPECLRAERTPLRKPKCHGTPECPHARRQAEMVLASAGLVQADDRRLFR